MTELRDLQLALERANEKLAAIQSRNAALEARYEAVFQHAGIGIALTTLQGTVTQSNEALQNMLGHAPDELQGLELTALIHPEDRRAHRTQLEAFAKGTRETVSLEGRYLHKNGEQILARVVLSLVRDARGDASYLIAILHDVTDLAEARSRAEILYSSASVGIWDWIDLNGDKEHWTPRFYELLGYEDGEIPATLANFQNALHPDDHERTFAAVTAHLEGAAPFSLDYRLRGKSGEYRWFHGTGHAVFDREGHPTRMVGSIHDIHDERSAKEQLEQLALRNELSLRASKIGVWDWDVQANHIVWDEQMYRLYGIRAEEWGSAYEAWLAGVHPEDREEGDTLIQQALSGETEFDTEFRVLWPSGEIRSIRAIAAVMRNPAGDPVRMVGVNWDVTADRERTRELERANRELQEFAYFASHDLQTPIRHVTSFVSLLKQQYADQFDETGLEWLGFISDGTTRMKNLVEDLLAYARVDRVKRRAESVDLQPMIDRVTDTLNSDRDTLPLAVSYDAIPTVVGNAVQLEQVVQNLLSNAIRYAKVDSQPTVAVTWDESPTHWRIHFRDEGIGIDPKFHRKIFEPFQRLTAKDTSGSGIGLAICTKVAESHGGAMTVASTPGEGSIFTLSLQKIMGIGHE